MSDDTNSEAVAPDAAADTSSTDVANGDNTGGDTTSVSTNDGGVDTNANDSSQAAPVDGYADFTLPDTIDMNTANLESASAVFKDMGLTQDQAQKLVDLEAANVQASAQAQVDAFNSMVDEWATASKNDSEFGGDKFEESIATAKAAITKFGTPELQELMNTHGVGNHPEVVRFMVRVGNLTKEDNPGKDGAPAANAEPDRATRLYG